MKQKILKGLAIFWTLFIGLGAVGGAIAMFIDPMGNSTGMCGLLPGLQKLPFSDALFHNLIFSGVSLFIVNGLTQLFTFVAIVKKLSPAPLFTMICGIILMLWITIQFFIFPLNVLSTAYFIFGLLEAVGGLIWLKTQRN